MTPQMKSQALASRQHWVVSIAQVRAHGVSKKMVGRLLARGEWKIVHPGVYLVAQARLTWKTKVMAAVLWAGPGAAASHDSAGALFGLEGVRPGAVMITSPRRRGHIPDGIRLRYDPDLSSKETATFDAIPVTKIERTVLDLCGSATERGAEIITASALRTRTTVHQLALILSREGRRGRRGTAVLRKLLTTKFAYGVTDSEAEDLFMQLCNRWHLKPKFHHVVEGGGFRAELDFAFLPEMFDVEIDGGADHDNEVAEQWDKVRDQELVARGWVVMRFTYWQLVREPELVRARIERALDARRPQLFTDGSL